MRNEVPAKFACHNLCCFISAIYERELAQVFGLAADASEEGDGPREVLKFPDGV